MKAILILLTVFVIQSSAQQDPFPNGYFEWNDPLDVAPQQPLFISLGAHCETAIQLNRLNLRKASFPFDWLVTRDYRNICNLLDTNFENFLNKFNYTPMQNPAVLLNLEHQIEFHHEWPKHLEYWPGAFDFQFSLFSEKYKRRIERFRSLRNYPGTIVFVRIPFDRDRDPDPRFAHQYYSQISLDQANKIRTSLINYFPSTHFILAIINYTEEDTVPFPATEGIFEFKISRKRKDVDYEEMLLALQTILSLDG
jgi:hypothetical protein